MEKAVVYRLSRKVQDKTEPGLIEFNPLLISIIVQIIAFIIKWIIARRQNKEENMNLIKKPTMLQKGCLKLYLWKNVDKKWRQPIYDGLMELSAALTEPEVAALLNTGGDLHNLV